jgi:hypothetical protein
VGDVPGREDLPARDGMCLECWISWTILLITNTCVKLYIKYSLVNELTGAEIVP